MSWFEKWFDSSYYHLLYKNRDKKEAQVFINKLITHLKIPRNSKILDVACGKGRHSVYFNKKGMDVVGIDLSINSIESAKKEESSRLQFHKHDMRKVFRKNYFDIVTNLFTSIGYFESDEDEQNTINAMALNLKQDGILVIDFMNVKKVIKQLVKYEVKTVDEVNFKIRRKVINNFITKSIGISENKKHYQFQEKVKALTLTNFAQYLKNADLKIINIFGNYRLENFDELTSERLIIICKK